MNMAKRKRHNNHQNVTLPSHQTAIVGLNKADEISVTPKFPKNFLITVILLSGVNEANQ